MFQFHATSLILDHWVIYLSTLLSTIHSRRINFPQVHMILNMSVVIFYIATSCQDVVIFFCFSVDVIGVVEDLAPVQLLPSNLGEVQLVRFTICDGR